MRWILNFDTKNKLNYFIYNFMIVFGDAIMILPGILIGKIVDIGIKGGNTNLILKLGIITILITIFGTLSSYIGVVLIDSWGFKLSEKLRNNLYEKLHLLDSSFYLKKPLGEVMTTIYDTNAIRFNMCYTVKTVLAALFRFIGAVVYCFLLSPKLTLIIIIPLPALFYVSNRFVKNSKKNYKERREYLSKFNNFIQENIDANRIVKNFGTEEKEIKEFKNKNNVLRNKILKIRYKFINYNLTTSALNELMCGLLVFFGFYFVMKGEITIGQWLVFDSLIWCLRSPFEQASSLLDNWQFFTVALEKYKSIINAKPAIKDGNLILEKKPHKIEFKNVSLKYDDKYAIRNFNMVINPNKTYALIGLVGSGKSSVIKLLLRLMDVSEGEILIDGLNIKNYTLKSLRENFGYVAQTPFLFSDTIKNNVNFGNEKLTDDEIKYYLSLAKADYVFKFNDGINEIIGEGGVNLSGGEKQRLALARALAFNPNILILDDITSALDFETELEVTKNINNLDYDCTKIIVAQKILSVKNADVIYVLEKGKLKQKGSHNTLIKEKGLYKDIYDIQKKGIKL